MSSTIDPDATQLYATGSMLIEIKCHNLVADNSSGKHVECGEKIIVAGNNIGDFVTCSKCNQRIEVTANSAKRQKLETPEPKPGKRSRRKKPASKSGEQKKKKRTQHDAVRIPINALGQMKIPENSQNRTSEKQTEPEFEDEEIRAPEAIVRCAKCGNACVHGRCSACGFIMPPFDRLYSPLKDIAIRPAGFQRWFMRTVGDSSNIGTLIMAGHFIFSMFVIVLIAIGVAFINGFWYGKEAGIWMLVGAGFSALFYLLFALKGRQFNRKPAARLAWFQRPFWNFILLLARILRWQGYDRRLQGRQVVKIKDRSFDDRRLAEMDLNRCEVLDLQRTNITNESLKQLCGLKNLRCLVLRKTSVTNEGVFRLQQARPQLWIWH